MTTQDSVYEASVEVAPCIEAVPEDVVAEHDRRKVPK
jgi:hypothetical protein